MVDLNLSYPWLLILLQLSVLFLPSILVLRMIQHRKELDALPKGLLVALTLFFPLVGPFIVASILLTQHTTPSELS